MKKFNMPGGFLVFCSLFLWSCGDQQTRERETEDGKDQVTANISWIYPDTMVSGVARFHQTKGGIVKLKLDLTIPLKANQSIAVHIHENGDCGSLGMDAGGHWNPTNKEHGNWGSGNFHLGDIGNVHLDSLGKGSLEMETDLWSIGGSEKSDIVGKSIIVHGGADDFVSQPSGNAGNRIGCGVIAPGNTAVSSR